MHFYIHSYIQYIYIVLKSDFSLSHTCEKEERNIENKSISLKEKGKGVDMENLHFRGHSRLIASTAIIKIHTLTYIEELDNVPETIYSIRLFLPLSLSFSLFHPDNI